MSDLWQKTVTLAQVFLRVLPLFPDIILQMLHSNSASYNKTIFSQRLTPSLYKAKNQIKLTTLSLSDLMITKYFSLSVFSK